MGRSPMSTARLRPQGLKARPIRTAQTSPARTERFARPENLVKPPNRWKTAQPASHQRLTNFISMHVSFVQLDILNLRAEIKQARRPKAAGPSHLTHVFHNSPPKGGRGYPYVRHRALRETPQRLPPVLRVRHPRHPLHRNRHQGRVLLPHPPHLALAHHHLPRRWLSPAAAHRPRLHLPPRQRDRPTPRRQIRRPQTRQQDPLRLPGRQLRPRRQTPRPETSPPATKSRHKPRIRATTLRARHPDPE